MKTKPAVVCGCADSSDTVTLSARPEAIIFAPGQTAPIVVDMQNAYPHAAAILISQDLMFLRLARLSIGSTWRLRRRAGPVYR